DCVAVRGDSDVRGGCGAGCILNWRGCAPVLRLSAQRDERKQRCSPMSRTYRDLCPHAESLMNCGSTYGNRNSRIGTDLRSSTCALRVRFRHSMVDVACRSTGGAFGMRSNELAQRCSDARERPRQNGVEQIARLLVSTLPLQQQHL